MITIGQFGSDLDALGLHATASQECKACIDVEQGMAPNRLVGINHVALEVGDVEQALAFYGRFFEFSLRGRGPGAAFIDIGDQFLALMEGRTGPADRARHFGLVVEDKEATRKALEAAGVEIRPGRRLDFQDPWGNTVEVVQYDQVQFTKSDRVLRGMGLELGKTPEALAELQEKSLA
jgi:catechol 2,3-dioxygenase-like lactoylglutathione lyase family enzyme